MDKVIAFAVSQRQLNMIERSINCSLADRMHVVEAVGMGKRQVGMGLIAGWIDFDCLPEQQ